MDMPDYMMVMLGSASAGDWDVCIEKLIASGKFRGESSLSNGVLTTKDGDEGECQVTGYMRFSAENIEQVKALMTGNPLYEVGGRVEVLEEIPD